MRRWTNLLLCGACSLLFAGGAAWGNTGAKTHAKAGATRTAPAETAQRPFTAPERAFIRDAVRANLDEIELGQLAQKKAQATGVKDFGQRMIRDHSQLNDRIITYVGSKGMMVPSTLSRRQRTDYQRLDRTSGARFDVDYMHLMVKNHDHDLGVFERESRKAQDPGLKKVVDAAIPVLQEHDRIAHQTLVKLVPAGRQMSGKRKVNLGPR